MWKVGREVTVIGELGPRNPQFHLPRVGPGHASAKGLGGVVSRYGFNQNPLSQFFNASLASVPSWNVPLYVSMI